MRGRGAITEETVFIKLFKESFYWMVTTITVNRYLEGRRPHGKKLLLTNFEYWRVVFEFSLD